MVILLRNNIVEELLKEYFLQNRDIVTQEQLLYAIYYICKMKKKTTWYKDDLIIELYKFFRRLNNNYTPLTLRSIEEKLRRLIKHNEYKKFIRITPVVFYINPFFHETRRYMYIVNLKLLEYFIERLKQ